jgi:hypothetical protein
MSSAALKTTDRARSRWRFSLNRRRQCTVALAGAAVMFCLPAPALAGDPPTILSTGINAADHLFATWSLGAGSNFSHVDFSTVATPDLTLPEFFADGNFAAFDCAAPPAVCAAPLTSTSFTGGFPTPRDRRYFVKVTAWADGAPDDALTSAVWVIDETKPVIPGDTPNVTSPPSNNPVFGHMLQEAAPPAPPEPPAQPTPPAPPPHPFVAPRASITVLSLPKSIGAVVRSGVRLRVTCTGAPCNASGSLLLNGQPLVRRHGSIPAATTRTLVLRPAGNGRIRLRKHSRARLQISGMATPAAGTPQRVSRSFTVRR